MAGLLARTWRWLEIYAMLEWLEDKIGLLSKLNALNEARQRQLADAIQSYVDQGWSRKKAEIYAAWELGLIHDPVAVCRMAGIE